jgi:hypothetical protein
MMGDDGFHELTMKNHGSVAVAIKTKDRRMRSYIWKLAEGSKLTAQYHGNSEDEILVSKCFSRIKGGGGGQKLIHYFWWRVTVEGTVRLISHGGGKDDEAALVARMSTMMFDDESEDDMPEEEY